jgi:transcriptional regulator with XRE-family HTH domain
MNRGESFGTVLRQIRTECNKTLEYVGHRLRPELSWKSAQHYVWQLESSRRVPTEQEIRLIAELFNVNLEALLAVMPVYLDNPGRVRRGPQRRKIKTPIECEGDIDNAAMTEHKVFHARHLREMQPEKMSKTINEILRGKSGYAGGRR